jgi:hypothetical protein
MSPQYHVACDETFTSVTSSRILDELCQQQRTTTTPPVTPSIPTLANSENTVTIDEEFHDAVDTIQPQNLMDNKESVVQGSPVSITNDSNNTVLKTVLESEVIEQPIHN